MRMQRTFMTAEAGGRFLTPALALLLACGLAACDSGAPGGAPGAGDPHGFHASSGGGTFQGGVPTRGKDRVEVCHRTSSESTPYVLLGVTSSAADTHLGHGDSLIGDEVPGQPGYTFGGNCSPVAPSASCPCYSASDIQLALDFNHEWVTLLDADPVAPFGQEGGEGRYVILDNDAASYVWTFLVRQVDGVHACGYNVYSLDLGSYEDDISAAEAEACRALMYPAEYEVGNEAWEISCENGQPSVFGESNSCGVPFTEGSPRPLATAQPTAQRLPVEFLDRQRRMMDFGERRRRAE